MRLVFALTFAVLLITGCAHTDSTYLGASGDVELPGSGTVTWPGGDAAATQNFVWEYETKAWRDHREAVFHRLRTDLRLAFDPATGEISNVTVGSTDHSTTHGKAFRHVCLTPGPTGSGLLSIRMTTLLDDRKEEVTVVKVHSTDPTTHMCEEYGVGPRDGLVEGVDVLFHEDGTFKILPNTGAYLAGAGLGMERKMTVSPDPEEVDVDVLP